MRFSFFLLSLLFFQVRAQATLCGDTTAAGGREEAASPRLTISTRHLQPTDQFAQHFADMFEALNILPAEIELPYSPNTLKLGHYKTPRKIQNAIDKLSKSLEGSVTLRFLALLCQKAAQDSNAPQHAGDLFLTLLNRAQMKVRTTGGELSLEVSEGGLRENLTQTTSMVFPTIATLNGGQRNTIAITALMGIRHYKRFLSGSLSAHQALIDFFLGGFQSIGYAQTVRPIASQTQASGILSNGSTKLSWSWNVAQLWQSPMMCLPSFQNLKALPLNWLGFAQIDGEEFMGLLALSPESAADLRTRITLLEQVLHPLFVKTRAYEIASKSEALFGPTGIPSIEPTDWERRSLFDAKDLAPFTTDREKLLAALAQIQKSAIAMVPKSVRAETLIHLSYKVLNFGADQNLTFRDLEEAARTYDLPIQYLAMPENGTKGFSRVWIGAHAKTKRRQPPTHSAMILVERPEETAAFLEAWGLDEETNRTLLATQTGFLANIPFDPRNN